MLSEWKKNGVLISVLGKRMFVVDSQSSDLPNLLILHGYPSSSFDYYKSFDTLKRHFRVIIPDYVGFGFSEKPEHYSYSLLEQADFVLALLMVLGIKEYHLFGHDYGTTVANEILAKRELGYEPAKVLSATFCNGSMHIELAHLKLVQKLMKHPFWGNLLNYFNTKALFIKTMSDIWYDKDKFSVEEANIHWHLIHENEGRKVFPKISRYNNERDQFWHRWIPCLTRLDIPVHILWAQEDPIAVKAIGEQLFKEIPHASITRLPNLGHYPMLEDAVRWQKALLDFYIQRGII